MHLVALADVGAEECAVEVGGGLTGIVAAPVEIVELEAQAKALVHISGENAADTVLAVTAASGLVVSNVREGRLRVSEKQLLGLGQEKVVRSFEDKLTAEHVMVLVRKDTSDAGRT